MDGAKESNGGSHRLVRPIGALVLPLASGVSVILARIEFRAIGP